ncbi:MAG: class I SAM-dependent methyltransferase [Clostridia bacterium]|nr:class I SAM-dependent methyltransferase [Clostridia bacterium]
MYNAFAYIYDDLMRDVDYAAWSDYYLKIANRFGVRPACALELGCGTASLSLEFSRRGVDMIGVDVSEDMLAVAAKKCAGRNILLLNQNMADFELYGTVDAVFASLDSVNYLTKKHDLRRMFALVNNYLNPGGIFVFDVNTEYKLRNVLGNNTFTYDDGEICYIWHSAYNTKSRLCGFDLTFFVKNNEHYLRFDEMQQERAYAESEIIQASCMEFLAAYEALTFKAPREKSERLVFVMREKGKLL